ncbi:MAG TPA: hypothetical protein VFH56_10410 [Acidimicrobiales bacterium]|nr:hypothetical protein [Acidimicrobiales bacterium]
MAQVTVFVDDAVLGRLPPICVKSGLPTDDTLTLRARIGDASRLGVAWLLVLAGPLGWLALAILAATGRPTETLTVELPLSEAAYGQLEQAKRAFWPLIVTMSMLLVALLLTLAHHDPLLKGTLGFAILAAAALWVRAIFRVRERSVTVGLDASRRWVTLSRVHPTFAESCSGRPPAAHDIPIDNRQS